MRKAWVELALYKAWVDIYYRSAAVCDRLQLLKHRKSALLLTQASRHHINIAKGLLVHCHYKTDVYISGPLLL